MNYVQSNETETTERYERSRRAIVLAAIGCFERKGVAGTKIVDVTRAAHITRELFYYYFSGKATLCDAVLEECVCQMAHVLAEWKERWDAGGLAAGDAALRDLVSVVRGLAFDDGGAHSTMLRVLRQLDYVPQGIWRACTHVGCPELAAYVYGVLGYMKADPLLDNDRVLRLARDAGTLFVRA